MKRLGMVFAAALVAMVVPSTWKDRKRIGGKVVPV